MQRELLSKISPKTLQERVDSYFSRCKSKKLNPTLSGLALHLGCTRRSLLDYKHTDILGPIIEEAKLRCEAHLEERLISGAPPTGMIFALKNNYGWKDKVEIDQTLNGTISLSSLFDRSREVKKLNESKAVEAEVIRESSDDNLFDEDDDSSDPF